MFKKSFSLIEVLVFLSILSLFFISAISVTSYFLRNVKNQQYKILATHFMEEAIEWLRFQKEISWNDFSSKSSINGVSYCLKYLNFNNQSLCQFYDLGPPNIFKRELVLKSLDSTPTKIEALIKVSWLDSNIERNVKSRLILALTE